MGDVNMVSHSDFTSQLGKEFETQMKQIQNCALVKAAQKGTLTMKELQEIAKQEYHIVPQEFRHVALSLLKTERTHPPRDLFIQRILADILDVFLGEWESYATFISTGGLTLEEVRNSEVLPGAHYFIAWSHYSGSALNPELHIAFLYFDWITWGQACTNIRDALVEDKTFPAQALTYLALFTSPDPQLMKRMRRCINDFAAQSDEHKWLLRWTIKLGLDAGKMFWDSIIDHGKQHAPFL
jgi:hypothetical protein